MSNILFGNNEDDSNNQELSAEDSLKLLVGEGAKYATVEDMAKAMVHSQNHITKLETEATSFKDAQAKQSGIDDILAAIKAGNEVQTPADDNLPTADQQSTGSSDVDVELLVKNAMAAQNQRATAEDNAALVRVALSKALGDRAGSVYSKVGSDLGVDLDKLSEQSPEAVIKLVTGQQPATSTNVSLPRTTVTGQQQNFNGELNKSAIEAMYKAGKITRDAKFKLEHSQAQKLGKEFFK